MNTMIRFTLAAVLIGASLPALAISDGIEDPQSGVGSRTSVVERESTMATTEGKATMAMTESEATMAPTEGPLALTAYESRSTQPVVEEDPFNRSFDAGG